MTSHHQARDDRLSPLRPELKISSPAVTHRNTKNFTIDFNVENPWQDILSSASRRQRSVDVWRVGAIRWEGKVESNQGENESVASVGCNMNSLRNSQQKPVGSLLNKLNFVCGLHDNPHYKAYLKHLKLMKLKRMLISKFASKMSDLQIERVKVEIEKSEVILNQFSVLDGKQQMQKNPTEKVLVLQGKQDYQKKVLGAVIKDRKLKDVGKTNPLLPFWQNRNNPVVKKSEESRSQSQVLQVVHLRVPTGDQSEPGEAMLALNIPIEDILTNKSF